MYLRPHKPHTQLSPPLTHAIISFSLISFWVWSNNICNGSQWSKQGRKPKGEKPLGGTHLTAYASVLSQWHLSLQAGYHQCLKKNCLKLILAQSCQTLSKFLNQMRLLIVNLQLMAVSRSLALSLCHQSPVSTITLCLVWHAVICISIVESCGFSQKNWSALSYFLACFAGVPAHWFSTNRVELRTLQSADCVGICN